MTQTLEQLQAELDQWTSWRRGVVERETRKIAEAKLALDDANHVFDKHATALNRAIAKLRPDEPVTTTGRKASKSANLHTEDGFTQEEIDLYNRLRKAS